MQKLQCIVGVFPFLLLIVFDIPLFSVFQEEVIIKVLYQEDRFIFEVRVEGYILEEFPGSTHVFGIFGIIYTTFVVASHHKNGGSEWNILEEDLPYLLKLVGTREIPNTNSLTTQLR